MRERRSHSPEGFWDFDKDDQADVAEGVSNATVTIDDGQTIIELKTDETGTYSTLVPRMSP